MSGKASDSRTKADRTTPKHVLKLRSTIFVNSPTSVGKDPVTNSLCPRCIPVVVARLQLVIGHTLQSLPLTKAKEEERDRTV